MAENHCWKSQETKSGPFVKQTLCQFAIQSWCAETDLAIDFKSITLQCPNYEERSDVRLNSDSACYA